MELAAVAHLVISCPEGKRFSQHRSIIPLWTTPRGTRFKWFETPLPKTKTHVQNQSLKYRTALGNEMRC